MVAAIDRRVKAVASQVPLVSGHDNLRALVRSDFIAGFREMFDAERRARFEGKPPAMVPVVDEDPLGASALPTADSWQWFTETGKARAHHPACWPPSVANAPASAANASNAGPARNLKLHNRAGESRPLCVTTSRAGPEPAQGII